MKEHDPVYDIVQDIKPYLAEYLPETKRYLYSGIYLKSKRRIKLGLKVSALDYDLVANDVVMTVYNGLKTFFQFGTGLIKYRYKRARKRHLTPFGRLKKTILFRLQDVLYLTHRLLAFRNLTFKVFSNHYEFVGFSYFERYLNKLMFFNLILKLNQFSFKYPTLIMYHYRKYKRLRIYYLGLRIILKRRKMDTLLSGTVVDNTRYKRRWKKKQLVPNSEREFLRNVVLFRWFRICIKNKKRHKKYEKNRNIFKNRK